jgi:hypothetical protein
MDLSPLLYMLVGAAGSLVMWLVLGPIMTGLGVRRMARKAAEGDQKSLEFFYDLGEILLKWAGTARKTGKKIQIPTGKIDEKDRPIMKASDEELAPVEMIAQVIGHYSVMHLKGFMGGKKTQMQEQIKNVMESGGDARAMLPIAVQAAAKGDYGPALMILMQEIINKPKPPPP